MPKYWSFLGLKLLYFNFSLILFIRFFWNFTWWQALKSGWKWLFLNNENISYVQNGENSLFLSPKPTLLNFFLNLPNWFLNTFKFLFKVKFIKFITFFWNYIQWQALKMGKSDHFGFWRNIHSMLKVV